MSGILRKKYFRGGEYRVFVSRVGAAIFNRVDPEVLSKKLALSKDMKEMR
jgi:hypothetical protein